MCLCTKYYTKGTVYSSGQGVDNNWAKRVMKQTFGMKIENT